MNTSITKYNDNYEIDELNIDLSIYDNEIKEKIIKYLKSLNKIELKALKIAINHLKSSFNIYKCNGFQNFINNL
jgi:hypothetical protein